MIADPRRIKKIKIHRSKDRSKQDRGVAQRASDGSMRVMTIKTVPTASPANEQTPATPSQPVTKNPP